jgi:hypothetical protein
MLAAAIRPMLGNSHEDPEDFTSAALLEEMVGIGPSATVVPASGGVGVVVAAGFGATAAGGGVGVVLVVVAEGDGLGVGAGAGATAAALTVMVPDPLGQPEDGQVPL